ncbi:MAG: ATP-binding protein [Thermoplasmata archaeon]|jgi:PAS domain S-box-containing protein
MPESRWFEETFDRATVGAVLLDREGRVLRTNPVFLGLLGIEGSLQGCVLSEMLSEAGGRLEIARLVALREGRKVELDGVILEPASRERRHQVDVEIYPQAGERSEVTGVLVIMNDRTGPRGDLADSARLFYEAFLHSTNAMELTDRDGFLVDVNPAFERIYGYRKEEVIGRRPNIVASGRTDRAVYTRMWKDLVDPNIGAWSGEVINQDREGIDHPVLLAITAIRGTDGVITHFLGVAVDLTERRAWERVGMHTERLASLGQLAAGVAHEINTPLANIMLIAESVRRRTDDPWTRGRVDSLLHQTESAARIVRSLLDFARRPEPHVGEVELAGLVTQSVGFLRGKQSVDVEVDVSVPPHRVVVRGDREQLIQVVTNLLNNAYEALEGKGRVEVRVTTDPEWAHVFVIDNGPGISPEVQNHLFEPFYTTKPEGKGTGLGLAICHGIVESHGGTIEVESELGHGATFEVRLRRVMEPPRGATP